MSEESRQPSLWRPGVNWAVDLVVRHNKRVLLIRRGAEPFLGGWALPGGFHETDAPPGELWRPGKETAQAAALRELHEETGISPQVSEAHLRPLGTFSDPGRDPRNTKEAWVWSRAFMIDFPRGAVLNISAGDDAAQARWFTREQVKNMQLAFDHPEMLQLAGFL